MDTAARTRALAKIPLFARLTRTHRERVAAAMTVRDFRQGDLLVRQGEPGDCVLALVDGRAEIRLRRSDGVVPLASVGPGSVLGEMALVTGAARNADAVAATECRALVLAAESFRALSAEIPDLVDLMTEVVAERLGRAAQDGLGDKVLEGFRVVRPVGRGGMAVVYEAERLADGRRLALKMMSHLFARDAGALARFDEEADLLAQFRHEGITRFHGRFSAYGTVFLVIDFVDGASLADVVEKSGPLPGDEARRAFGAIVAALAHVHRGGVVHGDLKPANVLVDAGGSLRLTDFGIARRVRDAPEVHRRGRITGTPHYMAPELFDGAPPSVQADVYAMGCVLVELLTGNPPVDASTLGALMAAKARLDPAALARHEALAAPDVRDAVVASLARDPSARHLDADRWIAAAGALRPSRVAAALLPGTVRADTASADAVKLLASKEWSEKVKGLEQLAALGRSADAEKAVLPLLEDDDWGVEIAACGTLAKVGGDAARDALVKRALDGEIQWVRDAAVDALKALDPDGGAARLLERARNASTKDEQIRERAFVSAGRIGGKDVLKKLTTHLGSKDEDIAAAAMRGVAELARDPALAKEVVDAVEPRLFVARGDRKNFFLYAAAVEALGHAAGAAASGMLVSEVVQQPDDDLYLQERIGRGLEGRPAEELANVMHTGFGQAKKTEEIRRVARLAGRAKCAGARSDLEALLDHKDERVRSEAAKALGILHDAASAPALRKALEDKSAYVRLEAVTALAKTLPPADFRGLGAKVRKDTIETIRLQLIVELADLGDPAGIAEIEPLLTDASWRVASAAAAAIGTLGAADDQPKLEPLLAQKSWQIRGAAFEGLGRLRAAKAIPLLTEGLLDKDPVVKGVCHANLQILTREKLGPEPKLWRDWWTKNGSGLSLVKQSRRSAAERAKEAEKNKGYGNVTTSDRGVEILQKARILVVTGAWDHVEKVLEHLSIAHTLLRAQQLKDAGINPNQTILVNCEGNMDSDSRARVQWFVNVGGYLMTTDWALTKTIEPGFPGYLKQFSGSSTGNDVVVVEDAHPGHPFTAGIFDRVPAMKWWLEIQAFPMTVTYPERTDVLVDSAEMRHRYGSSPMAATFRWGLGKVQHSISHFFLQEEGMSAAQKPRDRMVFAADNLGLSLDEIRRLAKAGRFDGQITEDAMKEIAPDYSMFRLIVNVAKEKSDWVESL